MAPNAVNQHERAFRAWPLLTGAAAKGATITYKELAANLAIHPRVDRYVLGVIQSHCLGEKLPPLTIVVVSQQGHLPGEGFIAWDVDDLDEGYRLVYGYPWHELTNPFTFADDGATLDELAEWLVSEPGESATVYAKVQNRGIAQDVFRRALLRAYGTRCAFCGLSFDVALQAAHVIPWSKASPAQRVSPRNGLLLCSTHHSLFDAHILTVTTERKIVCRPSELRGHHLSDADRRTSVALHGQRIHLPADPRLHPSVAALRKRADLIL